MSNSNPWADQWFKAQQQFVEAWSDMAKSSTTGSNTSQSDLWSQSFEMWRNASKQSSQPDIQQAMNKCLDMGKEYFSMAEQVSKTMSDGANPVEAINQWMDQLKQNLQKSSGMPGFDSNQFGDFMKQWFAPTQTWQQMASQMMPMDKSAWQMPGMNTSGFNMGEAEDPFAKMLSSPGIGYFRESQEQHQKGIQLALDYQKANSAFNQAFLRVALESIQGYQQRLTKFDAAGMPKSLRALYDLWVEVSEEHYAEFAMSEEYQVLYGDMVNRLMALKKHGNQISDDLLRTMNIPGSREVDTMQERLQQLRRENFKLKDEIREIREMLSKPAAKSDDAAKPPAETAKTPDAKKPAVKKVVAKKAVAKKAAVKKAAIKKKAVVKKSKSGA